ncbi:MAG: SidA/IucD/PvdA family monooxygenase [Acidobacteriota bacterium]
MDRTYALIIGAGPYGVGVAEALYAAGVDFRIVGEPFQLWQHHTLSTMFLRSDWNASSIYDPGNQLSFRRWLDADASRGERIVEERIPIDLYRQYLTELTENRPYKIHHGRVTSVEGPREQGARYRAVTDDGTVIEAQEVVVATGIGPHRFLPESLQQLPQDRVLHSWDTEAIEALEDRRVLVLGSGQSAAETVEALEPRNEIVWGLRHEPRFFREPLRVPTPIFKAILAVSPAYYFLPQAVRTPLTKSSFKATMTPNYRALYGSENIPKIFGNAEDLGLRESGSGIEGPKVGKVDAVVSCTGYRGQIGNLRFLAEDLRQRLGAADSAPDLDRHFRSRLPGLYFTGGIAEGTFGPAQRFILGSFFACRRISQSIVEGAAVDGAIAAKAA